MTYLDAQRSGRATPAAISCLLGLELLLSPVCVCVFVCVCVCVSTCVSDCNLLID
jgi:hypothetical protein